MIWKVVFWISVIWLVYVYLGYPALAWMLARWRRRRPSTAPSDSQALPSVSILTAAYNEAKAIEATLRNKLALDYPRDKLEILVVSDESTDGTDEIVTRVASESGIPIRLIRQTPRQGKTAGLNRLVPEARGELIVFADANSIYDTDALKHLVAAFADPEVGYVTGKMVYVNEDGSLVGDGCSAYMKYENWLRVQESTIGSIVGVDGGIDAMRKDLYEPLRADQLPDFVQPLKVVAKGSRVVYVAQARLKEPTTDSGSDEYRMRVRVTLRALWALKDMSLLLNPIRFGLFAWQLWSHKLLRYLAFVPLVTLALTSLWLVGSGVWFAAALIAQLSIYCAATYAWQRPSASAAHPITAAAYYFVLINAACLSATLAFLRGEKKVIWAPRTG
jgi:glycosyltransferase involved in cell wall biosynthesis